MRLVLAIVFGCWLSSGLHAQQSGSGTLTSEQKEGRRLFQQKCAVCHVKMNSLSTQYGPPLYKGRFQFESAEGFLRQIISDGRAASMPGFKYALQPQQIQSVMGYIMTLDEPVKTLASERPER